LRDGDGRLRGRLFEYFALGADRLKVLVEEEVVVGSASKLILHSEQLCFQDGVSEAQIAKKEGVRVSPTAFGSW
jgi:hypothetical protein